MTGRIAPSPTGRMHLGNAYAALAAWLGARAAGGRVLLRIEDIDAPRVVRDADRWIMDDLAWLGLDWDGEPVYQSRRLDLYEDVLRRLRSVALDGGVLQGGTPQDMPLAVGALRDALPSDAALGAGVSRDAALRGGSSRDAELRGAMPRGADPRSATPLVYPCFCSRADIRAASAPNEGDGFLVYPGTCQRLGESERAARLERGDRHSWRIAVPGPDAPESARVVTFADRVFGPQRFDLARQLGDVVVRRSDGLFAYQLAASVDDLLMGVTQVVRGRDLLRSTAIQLWIRRWVAACVAMRTPQFAHLPLIDAADGRRMAKRLNSLDLGTLRDRGVDPREVVGYCAWLLRVIDEPRPVTPAELVPGFSWDGLAGDHADRVVDVEGLFA
ncbi:glutamate--tRNA ligase family protein [Bifidobacterium phasiani]|uniref:glutamate--tRNA ligase family protein n=1 Tax=Bifidobacterium phasiani TaxID=2834431 RepID=UPI0030840823